MAKANSDNTNAFKKFGFKYPAADKIGSRTSTVARSMASTLMPRIKAEQKDDNSPLENKWKVYLCLLWGRGKSCRSFIPFGSR